ncbi:MAG: helix-turn-helix transcriptional regulator [Saprospiraceae bacterium]|nr:helix-turn-helix transcriptional regulator [Saprospiraceae bacterium]
MDINMKNFYLCLKMNLPKQIYMDDKTSIMSNFSPKILGHNIKEARDRLGIKQTDLADRLNISPHTMGNI